VKFGIFGDIHSNLEALEAVLEDMQEQKVTQAVCLGDIVGYNASPSECLELVRGIGCPIIKGNHDEDASEDWPLQDINELALMSMEYSRSHLTDEQKKFLRGLPMYKQIGHFSVVHSTLDNPVHWHYVFTAEDAARSFVHQRTQICFHGHTHVPHLFVKDSAVHEFSFKRVVVQDGKQYFVNVGSVGQPRDGDWRSAYAIYDSVQKVIELRRVPYDLAKAQAKILEAGLPDRLAERLANAV
jgi:predicted phosphodiesterase